MVNEKPLNWRGLALPGKVVFSRRFRYRLRGARFFRRGDCESRDSV